MGMMSGKVIHFPPFIYKNFWIKMKRLCEEARKEHVQRIAIAF